MTLGTLRLNVVPAAACSSTGTSAAAMAAGVSHGTGSSPQRIETARQRSPKCAPVSAAPTVPECMAERPTFMPWLIPDSTMSGRGPNPPTQARITARAGGPSMP